MAGTHIYPAVALELDESATIRSSFICNIKPQKGTSWGSTTKSGISQKENS